MYTVTVSLFWLFVSWFCSTVILEHVEVLPRCRARLSKHTSECVLLKPVRFQMAYSSSHTKPSCSACFPPSIVANAIPIKMATAKLQTLAIQVDTLSGILLIKSLRNGSDGLNVHAITPALFLAVALGGGFVGRVVKNISEQVRS